eukprot:6700501-Alexandrium_andersonii.AAC.1
MGGNCSFLRLPSGLSAAAPHPPQTTQKSASGARGVRGGCGPPGTRRGVRVAAAPWASAGNCRKKLPPTI